MKYLYFCIALVFSLSLQGQYKFKTEKIINCSDVKSQGRTGTCWSFATSSFLESELMRMGKGNVDLSEMYIVRNVYKDKARNYALRQGNAQFSQGSLSHDLVRTLSKKGLVPESAYSGLAAGEKKYDHSELARGLKGYLDGILKGKRLSNKWTIAFDNILDAYIGDVPEQFEYKGVKYTPQTFAKEMGLRTEDYVSMTSFSHHPFYEKFILEIPDNYSNGAYYNVPINELIATIDYALLAGYSIAWDGDVSEKGFSSKDGLAILPVDIEREDLFKQPGKEIEVNQDNRQENFESFSTTDDHLMHIVGIALDQDGTKYYLIKNSWGSDRGPYEGYLYMSKAYMKMKTTGIMLHKDGVPKATKNKLKM